MHYQLTIQVSRYRVSAQQSRRGTVRVCGLCQVWMMACWMSWCISISQSARKVRSQVTAWKCVTEPRNYQPCRTAFIIWLIISSCKQEKYWVKYIKCRRRSQIACSINSNPWSAKLNHLNFHPLKLCLATATHNFKWVTITYICLFVDRIYANLDVYYSFDFQMGVIWSASKIK